MAKTQRITASDLDRGLKFATWDLETTGLNASFGSILCCTIKPLNKEPIVYRIDNYKLYKKEPWNDKELVVDIRNALEEYNVAISYNGFRFDIPMLNSRLTRHKLRVLSPIVKHLDMINVARHRLLLNSNSLESLLAHLQANTRKTALEPQEWARAVAGSKEALDSVVEHNVKDTESLEEAFHELIPYLDIQFRLVK